MFLYNTILSISTAFVICLTHLWVPGLISRVSGVLRCLLVYKENDHWNSGNASHKDYRISQKPWKVWVYPQYKGYTIPYQQSDKWQKDIYPSKLIINIYFSFNDFSLQTQYKKSLVSVMPRRYQTISTRQHYLSKNLA